MNLPTFIKWPGGKRRLISQLEKYFPEKFGTYFEPFLGAGAIFFYIRINRAPKKCIISDINKDLIDTYIAVRDNPQLLIKHLVWFKRQHSKNFYYKVRQLFNEHRFKNIKRCAAFIYLNKTCFNGIYRVNKKNEFNVPIGRYKNPEIFNQNTILYASELLQDTIILCQDYREILTLVKKNDFVYLDPCYDPLKKTSFTEYTPDKFSLQDRYDLHQFILSLDKKEAFFLLSNNNILEVKALYKQTAIFSISEITAARCVNGDVKKRGKITELAISNA